MNISVAGEIVVVVDLVSAERKTHVPMTRAEFDDFEKFLQRLQSVGLKFSKRELGVLRKAWDCREVDGVRQGESKK